MELAAIDKKRIRILNIGITPSDRPALKDVAGYLIRKESLALKA